MSPAEFVLAIALYTCSNENTLVREKHVGSIAKIHYKTVYQHVRLLISARAYQLTNSVFLSQRSSTSRAYQSRNQPANMLYSYFEQRLLQWRIDCDVMPQTCNQITSGNKNKRPTVGDIRIQHCFPMACSCNAFTPCPCVANRQ